MYCIANLNCNPSLPYGNLLTRIFTHFQVPLDGEECSTHPVPIISANSLKTLRFYKTESRWWQHIHDPTQAEAASLNVSISDQPSPNITKTLLELQEDNAHLQAQIDQLQLDLGLTNRKFDELVRLTCLLNRVSSPPFLCNRQIVPGLQIMLSSSFSPPLQLLLFVSTVFSIVFCFPKASTCVTDIFSPYF